MNRKPVVLSVAGTDPSGCAGMQADLLTSFQFGVNAYSVATAVTAQTLTLLTDKFILPAQSVRHQLSSLPVPDAVKIGMLGEMAVIDVIDEYLQKCLCFKVLDPLLISSSGQPLFDGSIEAYGQRLKKLFKWVDLLTPNSEEAAWLSGITIRGADDIPLAANSLLEQGVKAVVIKGGHVAGDFCSDYYTDGIYSFWLSSKRIMKKNCRGTGCVFSSAIAAAVALGYSIQDALTIAKMYLNRGIRLAEVSSSFSYLVHGEPFTYDCIDLPCLTSKPLVRAQLSFPRQHEYQLGLYPVVDSLEWLKRLLPLGIPFMQLRIKNRSHDELDEMVGAAVALGRQYQAKLYINDHWQLAVKHGAYGVHLGQEDLAVTDMDAIRVAGLRLGISTHCYHELARAHALEPSYIAYGPLYHTTSKRMAFSAQGLLMLKAWRQLVSVPLVAIGGINLTNIDEVLAADVNGIALISAITESDNPEYSASLLKNKVLSYAA